VVIGVQDPEVSDYLERIAAERGAGIARTEHYRVAGVEINQSGTAFTVDCPAFGILPVRMGLIGRHQVDNCLNVIAGFELLASRGWQVNREHLLTGLAQAVWPGRFERMAGVEQPRLYFDGTHNPDGIRALVDTIKTVYPGQKVDLLFGKLNNRPSEEMAALLAEVARKVITTTVPYGPTTTAEELAEAFQNWGIEAFPEPDPAAALNRLLKTDNPIAVATGSFYLTGYLRKVLYKMEE